jgi:hypothetical protein
MFYRLDHDGSGEVSRSLATKGPVHGITVLGEGWRNLGN